MVAGPEREGSGAFQPTRKVANAIARIVVEGIASDTKAGENGESMAVASLLRSLFSQSAETSFCALSLGLSRREPLFLFWRRKNLPHRPQLSPPRRLRTDSRFSILPS